MSTEITWRPATPDDVGRLARFRDYQDDDWEYGILATANGIVYEMHLIKRFTPETFLFCEVQVVPPKLRGLKWKYQGDSDGFAIWTAEKGDIAYHVVKASKDHPWRFNKCIGGCRHFDFQVVDSADHGKALAWDLWTKRVMEEVIEA